MRNKPAPATSTLQATLPYVPTRTGYAGSPRSIPLTARFEPEPTGNGWSLTVPTAPTLSYTRSSQAIKKSGAILKDRTEIDLQLNTLFVEAKLTESSFQTAKPRLI